MPSPPRLLVASNITRQRHAINTASIRLPLTIRRSFGRQPLAPKPAIDIKHIRQNPGLYEQNCIDRNYRAQSKSSWRILESHQEWDASRRLSTPLQGKNKQLREQIAQISGPGKHEDTVMIRQALINESKSVNEELRDLEARQADLLRGIDSLAQDLPNLSSVHTPVGEDPQLLGYINENAGPKTAHEISHVDIGNELGLIDFSGSAQTSGWGFYSLVGDAAMLEQALVQYALSVARSKGWTPVAPPSVVYSHIASACGFQPRDQNGEQQIYAIEQPEKDKSKPQLALAATAEIPLAGMKANYTFTETDLPLKAVGASRCYRAEAGARGKDTKGLYRVHEFTKVEMFAWARPDHTGDDHFVEGATSSSEEILEQMLSIQKEILTNLGLRCRILEMPTTDLGASATRKIDIEAMFPSRQESNGGWGELTSVSMCTDYQTRRLNTRVKINGDKLMFPYTLNGTALAVPRVLAAILENHWNEEERSVTIPEVLRPFMGGQEKIQAR